MSGSSNQSATKNGATASWTRYEYAMSSIATLAGSQQTNGWKSTEPEGCKVTFRNKTFTFPRPTITVANSRGTVTGGGLSDGYYVYNYGDKLTYTRGNNSKTLTAEGVIRVSEPTFFPTKWGRLVEVKQTVANRENHYGSVYTWSLRFANGYVLPVVIRPGSNIPEWHFEYAEETTITEYNGGTYDKASNTWINTTAADMPNQMTWSRLSKEKANKDYQMALSQNWDEGRLVDGHPSTTTSRYQLTLSSDGRLAATDTYTGVYMGSWK